LAEPEHPANNAHLTLVTLGGASLLRESVSGASVIAVPLGKPLALLVYLACAPGRAATRDQLIELLWANLGTAEARHSLRQTLWYLRRRTSDGLISTDGDAVQLASALPSDHDDFLRSVEEQELDAAVAIYKGEFLADFAAPGARRFEHWLGGERAHLAATFLRTAEIVARRWLSAGRTRDAVNLARSVRDGDRLSEGAWRLLLEALVSAGDSVGAAAEADQLEALLRGEDRDPEPATTGALRIARKAAPMIPLTSAPPLGAELVGREREFATIIGEWEKVRLHGRHLSVVAPAGLGKTRILDDAAARLAAARATVVKVRAFPGDRHMPYAFIGNVITALAGLPGAAGISEESSRALVAIDPSLPLARSGAPDSSDGSERLRRRTMALIELISAVTDERRIAVFLDDCQWADESSRSMLRAMIERATDHRLLLVTSARPHSAATIASPDTLTIPLPPLTDVQVRALLSSIATLPSEGWVEWFHAELLRVTGGSPLIVLETLQLLVERGVLQTVAGRWVARSSDQVLASLHAGGALTMRVATLPAAHLETLALLAVAGSPLPQRVLERACPSVDSLDDIMEQLEHRGLVVHSTPGWQVAHDEIGFAALEALGHGELYEVHVRIGVALSRESDEEDATLRRAASHLAMGNAIEELRTLADRWMRTRRERGYLRPAAQLLRDLLGQHSDLAPHLARYLPWWLRIDRRPVFLAGTVFVVAVAIFAVTARVASQPTQSARLVVAIGGEDAAHQLVLDAPRLRREGVARLEQLPLRDRARSLLAGLPQASRPDPHQRAIAFHRESGDSGGLDLYLRDQNGRERRLTFAPRDDASPSWSPDGGRLAFATGRWDAARMRNQIAVLDIRTMAVTRLTSNDHVDGPPHWSPYGSRIGFMRNRFDLQPAELCWISVDGRRERCEVPAAGRLLEVLGWTSPRSLLALLDIDGLQRLAILDANTAAARVLDVPGVTAVSEIHDAEWVTCDCGAGGDNSGLSLLHVTSETVLPLMIGGNPVPRGATLAWLPPPHSAAWADDVEIVMPPTGIPLESRVRLAAYGRSPTGARLSLPHAVVEWSVRDTTVASIDSLGTVRGVRRGSTLVTASAGGWRSSSATLVVTGSPHSQVLIERWSSGLQQWEPFGTPAPSVTSTPSGPAMANNGDGSYPSGLTSRMAWPGVRGIGVEARLSTPINQMQWQRIVVALEPRTPAGTRHWDRKLGSIPPDAAGSCQFRYPAGEGSAGVDRLRFRQRSVITDPRLRSGDWYTVRIQVFPDGRCGLAIDGTPISISELPGSVTGNYGVHLYGDMVGSRLLVGPVEAWTGVRDGVDWSVLDDDRE
jgi:DNA-binding SARP family transcriptional activator